MKAPWIAGLFTGAALTLALFAIALAPDARAADPPEKGRADAGAPPEKGDGGTDKVPKCVKVRSEARFSGYGYDHVVEIDNRCDKSVNCKIATDVNPQPQTISVKKAEKQSVLTFRGSPSSEFKPDVTCKLAS